MKQHQGQLAQCCTGRETPKQSPTRTRFVGRFVALRVSQVHGGRCTRSDSVDRASSQNVSHVRLATMY